MCNFGFQPEALNRAFLDIFEELLVLQNFFSCKITPPHCKNHFCKSKGSPLWMLKIKILQIILHMMAFGHTIPKWYNTWVLQIFFVNTWCQKYFQNIIQNIFNT